MAYTTSGYHDLIETWQSGNNTSTKHQRIDVSTTGKGLYGIAQYTTFAPYLGKTINTYLLNIIKSVDETPVYYNCLKVDGSEVKGSSTTVDYRGLTANSAIFYVIGTFTFDNGQTGSSRLLIVDSGGCTIPVFDEKDNESINRYIETGDDSGAVNYDELHGSKCDFYLTNNGDRISLKIKPQKDSDIILCDSATLTFHSGVPLTTDKTISVSGYEFNTTWDSITSGMSVLTSQKLLNTLEVTINGYYKNELVCILKAEIKKGFVMGIGNPTCTPIIGIDNDYRLYCSTNNMFDDISTPEDNESDATGNNSDGSAFGGIANLSPTYKISKTALNDLGRFIWNDNIFDNIKLLNNSPLENIISLIYMPVDITGVADNVVLGNINTRVSGVRIDKNMTKINVASFTMPLFNNGFLAYEPYTSISLYLPFVGMIDLQPKDVCGYTINIDYAFDVVYGSFGVFVYTSKGGGKTLIYSSQGECSVNIPLSSSNQSNVQASIMQSGVGLVSDIASKNVLSAVNDVMNIATVQNHTTTFGTPSSMVGALCPTTCYYIARTPIISLPDNFAHTKGYICMNSYKLKELKGFTKLTNDVDLSGFNCTNNELERLRSILVSGFYL